MYVGEICSLKRRKCGLFGALRRFLHPALRDDCEGWGHPVKTAKAGPPPAAKDDNQKAKYDNKKRQKMTLLRSPDAEVSAAMHQAHEV